MVSVAYYLGRALLVWTVVAAVAAALRRKERQRLDIALFMSAMLVSGNVWAFLPFSSALKLGLVTLLPWFTLRLVAHFRRVPSALSWASAVLPLILAIFQLAFGGRTLSPVTYVLSQGYLALLFCFSAAMMALEGKRSVGLKARRLFFAAIGTGTFGLTSLMVVLVHLSGYRGRADYPIVIYLDTVSLICYYLAFNTPRGLTTRWRRAEQATHLSLSAEREPEERGARAGDDLIEGADRCVGGSLTFVAYRSPGQAGPLAIRAASDPILVGRRIPAGPGLITRVLDTGVAELGTPLDCEPEVANALAGNGIAVLAAPIVADSMSWGVVLVVHRRGALFPHDDLSVLAQLGRNAAVALDHAALVVERRERARRESQRRLRELESRVGPMLDSIKDYAMLVLDDAGVVAAWHLGAQHLFGHSREQITRQSGATLFDLTPEAFGEWLREATRNGFAEREGPCQRFDGQTFTGITTIRPLESDPEAPPGFAVVTRDITEQRHLEERLRQSQKMQAIGQLAGGVAHDFNNLLTAILGYADWLEQDLHGDPRVEQVKEIQQAAERAADLTRRLLAFSRKQMVQPTRINVGQLVGDMLPMLRRLIGERIPIVDETMPLTAAVLGDRTQVEQIVFNLVLNARDAMPHGGVMTIRTGDVWCDGAGPVRGLFGPYVQLEVIDTGIGMNEETRRRAFEPFFTTKDVGSGTGLGLATVYGIVQQMKGAVEIESEPGQGATFRLFFPYASAPAVASLAETDLALRGRETVLIVEDDPTLRPYLVQVLECNGYRVIAAGDSDAALSMVEAFSEPIDLVISDVLMPGKTGPELVRELLRSRPGIPALFISGHAEALLPRMSEQVADRQLLQKPFSSTDLLARVRQILAAA
ncbi:MAG: ATP-binding protein [Acidobacteriota bacterium]